jgi:hypothetical protein
MPSKNAPTPQPDPQTQQIPVAATQGNAGQQAGAASASPSQQNPGSVDRQSVELADTPVIADVLARRLGLTSHQLAQAVPQLGAALGSPQEGQAQHWTPTQPIAQQPGGQQFGATQPGLDR